MISKILSDFIVSVSFISESALDSFLKKFRNFSQIDKKMKIKVDENLFSAIISVMTKVSRREFVAPFFVSLIIFW